MVKLHSPKTFVVNPIDSWKKEMVMGPAEQVVRLGSPLIFDQRGSMLFHDDFESTTKKYGDHVDAGGTVARSTDHAKRGDACIKATTNTNVADVAGVEYLYTDYHDGKIGAQVSMYTPNFPTTLELSIAHYDGTFMHHAQLKYYLKTPNCLTKVVDVGGLENIVSSAIDCYISVTNQNFATFKLVIDTNTDKYVRALLLRNEIDLSEYSMEKSASTNSPHLRIRAFIISAGGLAEVAYIDDFIITENEPA